VWKRIKVLALVLATLLLAWLTHSTWLKLVFPDSRSKSADNMSLTLFVPWTADGSAEIDFFGSFRSITESGEDSPGFSTQVSFWTTARTDKGTFDGLYLASSGGASESLRKCSQLREIDKNILTQRVTQPVLEENPKVAFDAAFAAPEGNAGCDLPGELFWSANDARYSLSVPRVTIVVYGHYEPSAFQRPKDGSYCNSVALYESQGTEIVEQPSVNVQQSSLRPNNSNSWQNCSAAATVRTIGDTPAIAHYIQSGPLSISLIDLAQNDHVSRNLFFAGVFAGILGAMAIEIFNGVFDVIESRSARRQIQDDDEGDNSDPPQPEPELDDQTYDPGPRGYL
jgi:hypothetical protein